MRHQAIAAATKATHTAAQAATGSRWPCAHSPFPIAAFVSTAAELIAPKVQVHPACAHAPTAQARAPEVRSEGGTMATRATASPVRLGVTKPKVIPVKTSRMLRDQGLRSADVNACHLAVSNPKLTGIPRMNNQSNRGLGGCQNTWETSSSCHILCSINVHTT